MGVQQRLHQGRARTRAPDEEYPAPDVPVACIARRFAQRIGKARVLLQTPRVQGVHPAAARCVAVPTSTGAMAWTRAWNWRRLAR